MQQLDQMHRSSVSRPLRRRTRPETEVGRAAQTQEKRARRGSSGSRTVTYLVGTLVAALAALALAKPISAAPGLYCFNGVTTDILPSPAITGSSATLGSHTVFPTLGTAELILGNGWSVFYFGYAPSNSTWEIAASPSSLEPG